MASVYEKGGVWTIQFDLNRKRWWLRVPESGERERERFIEKVNDLIKARRVGTKADDGLERWLAKLPDETYSRLVRVELADPRVSSEPEPAAPVVTLGAWVAEYIDGHPSAKPQTRVVWKHTQRCLRDYFRDDKPLAEITSDDAEHWRVWLAEKQSLARDTVRRRCGLAKQFLAAAVKRKLIETNPFAELPVTVGTDAAKHYYIPLEDIRRIIDDCPTAEWKCVFALTRYAGVRMPSEAFGLLWTDVDWEKSRFYVRSPKTEHHAAGSGRHVPILPELLPILREAFEAAEAGAVYVLPTLRKGAANLRTHATRLIIRAGVAVWPKLFVNARASAEQDLSERFPIQTVAQWLGHSPRVALAHYSRVKETDFRRAAGLPETADAAAKTAPPKAPLNCNEPAGIKRQGMSDESALRGRARRFSDKQGESVGAAGFEPA